MRLQRIDEQQKDEEADREFLVGLTQKSPHHAKLSFKPTLLGIEARLSISQGGKCGILAVMP